MLVLDLATWRRKRALELTKASGWDKIEAGIESWLAFLSASDQLDPEALPASMGTTPFKEALDIMSVFTKKDHERQLYQARLDGERIRRAELHYATEKGLAEGREEGREEEARTVARTMKTKGYPAVEIAEITGLAIEVVLAL